MCNFFSCIVTKDAKVLFTEVDSHEEVILRSGLHDDAMDFVRIEYTEEKGYRIDERTIQEWYERIAAQAEQAVIATYRRIQPSWSEYDKIVQAAHADKIVQAAHAEYKRGIANVQGYEKDSEVVL